MVPQSKFSRASTLWKCPVPSCCTTQGPLPVAGDGQSQAGCNGALLEEGEQLLSHGGWEERGEVCWGKIGSRGSKGAGVRGWAALGETSPLNLLLERRLFKWNLNLRRRVRNFPASSEDVRWHGQGCTGQACAQPEARPRSSMPQSDCHGRGLAVGSAGCTKPPLHEGKQKRLPKPGFLEDNAAKH